MSNGIVPVGRSRSWLARVAWALAAVVALGAATAWAQDDPPGRVGRLAELQGQVSWFDHEEGQWSEAERNRPLTSGDRISTAARARAELRVGSTVLRLGGATEIEVLRLDDERMSFQLHGGSLALRVRSREVAEEIEVVSAEVRLHPLRSGHYRVDRIDDTTWAGSWRGSLRIDEAGSVVIDSGQRIEFWREGASRELRFTSGSLPADDFAEWVSSEDLREQKSAATQYVSPEMTGAEDLDRHGRWEAHPEYGTVWFPFEVRSGWAPYRYGRWVWVRPWGWTWVDESPWGFAPFHYGRWVHWRGRWGWWPGEYVARPVFAPALVAWVGGSNWGVSVNIGGPAIGWVPLAPRDVFVPWYRSTPVYVDRINRRPPPPPGRRPVPQVPTGPVMYGNQGVPGAVTVVPRDVLVKRQPVSRAVIEPRGGGSPAQPWVGVAPPTAPAPRVGGDGNAPPPHAPPPVRREPREPSGPRETRPPGQVGPPVEARPPPQRVPPAERVAPPPMGQTTTTAPPVRRVDPAPEADHRGHRPAPGDAPVQRENGRSERPARPVTPAPGVFGPAAPAATGPAAPRPAAPAVVPVPPPVAAPAQPVVRTPPPAAAPAPPAARTPPPAAAPAPPAVRNPPPVASPAPAPADPPRDRDDERKRVPESRQNPRESLR